MFTIRTEDTFSLTGLAQVVATCEGRSRTIRASKAKSSEQNHAAAAGTLLNLMTTPEQQAKVRHPSGGQRVHVSHVEIHENVFVTNWYIEV